tara:strand:- start:1325 stop:1660 length:336 start_codon:yes stop_codon:yes gene_type:complete
MSFAIYGQLSIELDEDTYQILCVDNEIRLLLPVVSKINVMTGSNTALQRKFLIETAKKLNTHELTMYVYQGKDLLAVVGRKARASILTSILTGPHIEIKNRRKVIQLIKGK